MSNGQADTPRRPLASKSHARTAAINSRLALVAIGLSEYGQSRMLQLELDRLLLSGSCRVYSFSPVTLRSALSHTNALRTALNSTATHLETGRVICATWLAYDVLLQSISDYAGRSSDGYALAIGWERGWSVWSPYGRLSFWGVGGTASGAESEPSSTFEDQFLRGVISMVNTTAILPAFAP